MVKEEEDHRYDKLSDYSILKVLNEVTHIIIEVKESIGTVIGKAMRNEFARLFLEAIYCYNKEQHKEMYGQILCVLTDGYTWHFLTTTMTGKPLTFRDYLKITMATKYTGSEVGEVCNYIISYVKNVCEN